MDVSPGVLSICWSCNSRFVAWTCADGHVRQWDCAEFRLLGPIQLPSARLIAYSRPEPQFLAVSDETKPFVRIIDATSGTILSTISESSNVTVMSSSVSAGTVVALTPCYMSLSKSSTAQGCFAIANRADVNIISFSSAPLASFTCGGNVVAATFLMEDGPAPRRIATGDSRGACRIWDVSNSEALPYSKPHCLQVLNAHSSWITSLSFSPDNGRHLATVSFDGTAKIWDASSRRGSCLATFSVGGRQNNVKLHAGSYAAREFSSPLIAVGGSDTLVRVWHASPDENGNAKSQREEPLAVLKGHTSAVFAVASAPDASRLVSGSSDGYIRLWTIPGAPIVLSDPNSARNGVPEDVLAPPRNMSGALIFCPEDAKSLKCDICAMPYDSEQRAPVVSGVCGHTIACKVCNQKLWEHSDKTPPRCPQCRAELQDVAPNYELIRVLKVSDGGSRDSTAPDSTGEHTVHTNSDEYTSIASWRSTSNLCLEDCEFIDHSRLRWFDSPQCELTSSIYTRTVSGRMDGEAVVLKIARRFGPAQSDLATEAKKRIESNIIIASNLRGPHIQQYYGASRAPMPDGRVLLIGEQPCGGSLASNLENVRSEDSSLQVAVALNIASQLVRAILHLHNSGVARPNLTPKNVMLSAELHHWTPQEHAKLEEFGGCISRKGASSCRSLSLATSGEVAYLPPEALDPDTTDVTSDIIAFDRACRMDMVCFPHILLLPMPCNM